MENANKAQPQMDRRFNILSYDQYLIDMETKKFNKICMTDIMNADIMIATFGEEEYNKTCTEILAMGNMAYKQMGIDHLIHVYAHTYKTFMAVANDDMSDQDFLNLMKTNHEQYELITAEQTTLGGVSRFAVAFGEDLVNRCKSAFWINRKLQNNFLIVANERELIIAESKKNVEKFDLLNYAIKNDKVVPFYQGIRDNESGTITKFEALMRIYDQEGKLRSPADFLDAAKQLKLYLQLSKIMINKALLEFETRDTELSLNISLFDIQSEEFKAWFLKRIKSHPHPEKVIIEFVETENYNSGELFEFLGDVRKLGCKIAVDDFGVGFATYTSIICVKPDIIKVDGDIIRNLTTSDENRIILDSICYMARLINAEVVAEFVSDEEIQEQVMNNNVKFSQGFYFARPCPLCEL